MTIFYTCKKSKITKRKKILMRLFLLKSTPQIDPRESVISPLYGFREIMWKVNYILYLGR